MKKTLLPVLLLLFAIPVFAQQKKVEYGFQGGINVNRAYGKGIVLLLSSTTGLSAGVQVKLNTSKHFGVKLLPSYDQFGWSNRSLFFENGTQANTKTDLIYKLNYFNLPVLAEYSFGKKVRLNIDAGLFTGILLQNKVVEKTTPSSTIDRPPVYTLILHDKKQLNFGLAMGVGMQIPLSSKIMLGIDFRNVTGLTNLYKFSTSYSSVKTLTYSFLSGLSFQI